MLKSPFNIVKKKSKHFSVCSSDAVFRLFTVTGLTDVTHALQLTFPHGSFTKYPVDPICLDKQRPYHNTEADAEHKQHSFTKPLCSLQ